MSVRGLSLTLSSLLILACGQGTMAGPQTDIDKASRYSQRGFRALDSGNVTKAKTQFENALKLVPGFPDAHIGLGHVATSEQRFEDALWEYRAALDGHAQLAEQMYDIEMKRFHEARSLIPRLQQELLMLQSGDINLSASERRFRITDIENQIRDIENLQPPSRGGAEGAPATVHYHIGNALSRLMRWDEAIEAFETCVRKRPDFGQAYNNLALAYWRGGRIKAAVESLEKAEELGVEVNPRFRSDLQRAREQIREPAEADGGS
jgi:tetratricopeptide (TPR) repeat protein